MIDNRILQELRRKRELIVRNIERYTAERLELLGKENYYDDEIQRILNKEKGKKTEERVEFLDGRLKELKNKLGKINKVLSWEKEKRKGEKERKRTEKRQDETKFLIIFLALLAITGLFLFSDYLKLEFGPTGFVVSSGVSNATAHEVQNVIGGNVTIELRPGDIIPNDTLVNVSFNGNQSNTTYLEYFIYASSELLTWTTEPNSSTSPFIDVDGVSSWEGLTGYGWSVNETPTSPFDGGNITVDLDNLFEGGLIAPSIGGIYEIIINATFENETGELVVSSTTQITVGNWLDVNLTIPDPNTGDSVVQYNTFSINASITCQGASTGCGTVTASSRYNESATPDTAINEIDYGDNITTPFYIDSIYGNTAFLNDSNGGFNYGSVTGGTNPTGITTNGSDLWISDGVDDFIYHTSLTGTNYSDGFNYGSVTGGTTPTGITTNGSDLWISEFDNTSFIFFIYHTSLTGTNYSDGFNYGSVTGGTHLTDVVALQSLSSPVTDLFMTDDDQDFVYHTTTKPNPYSCGNLNRDDSCSISWVVNATEAANYEIDVNFVSNNTLVADNDTLDATVSVSAANAAPTTPDLNLPVNNSQIETDILIVELNWSNSTDTEGDSLTYYLEIWNESSATNIMYVNSSISETDNTTEDLVTFPNETKDYFWRVLATDTGSNSSFSDLRNISIRVTVSNTAPNNPIGVIINSTTTDQLNQTNETLDMNFYCDDPEANPMNWYTLVYRNGIEQFSLGGTCADNTYTVVKLDDANTTVGQLWSFGVIIDDGTLNNTGGYQYSENITIANTGPTISDVSLGGRSYSPTAGGTTEIEVSFLADEIDGTDHLDNSTALVNVSYQSLTGAGLLSDSNSSCSSATIDTDTMNYSCYVQLEYFWDHSTVWTVDAQISDINSSLDLNSSNQASDGLNWTVQELIASNFSSTSLSWAGVVPLDTNASSTTNLTNENIGNSLSLLLTTIVIDLGASETATYIPAINFTVFNITNTDKIECDYTNQSEAVNSGVKPFVGVNNTAIVWLNNTLKRGQGTNPETANYCLFDVPSSLISGEYNTSFGGAWDLTTGDSGE